MGVVSAVQRIVSAMTMIHHDAALTEAEAIATTREWIENRIPAPKGYGRSQTRWLMEQLATRCMVESLQRQESEHQLCDRLAAAWDILNSAWYAAAPEYATRWRKSGEAEPDAQETQKIEKARHSIWRRRDPKRSFQEGYESEHYFKGDRDSLNSTISDYLERPWLRHATLDWMLLDMSITSELCSYGEALKERWLPGKRDELGAFHHRYFSAKGNLTKMTKLNWSELFESLWVKFVWVIAIPVGAIWAGFHYGYDGLAATLTSMYATLIGGFIAVKLIKFLMRTAYRLVGKPDPLLKPFALWDDMYEVWRRLEGPVVNPTRLREAMSKSADNGAVWDSVSWSMVDKVIAIDPAVWVIQPTEIAR